MIAKQILEGKAASLAAIFENTVQKYGSKSAALTKRDGQWVDVTWTTLGDDARAISDGLASLGIGKGDRVAILGNTSVDWIKADMGVIGSGAVEVPIYQSNKPHECAYILNDAGAKFILCDTRAQAKKILEIKAQLPGLAGIFCFEAGGDGTYERTIAQLQELGRTWRKSNEAAHAKVIDSIGEGDLCCIIYTAGTTGDPKGVMLSHSNWTYEAAAIESLDVLRVDDVLLMFLPMAHVLGKVLATAWFRLGFQMAFAESVDKLLDNAGEVHPTILPAVPRIFEKAFSAVIGQGAQAPGFKGKLFRMAMENFELYAQAKSQGRNFNSLGLMLGRRLVFPKIGERLKARFGGRLRYCVSGSAPLNPKIAYFFQEVGLVILEGYGLSETSATTTVNIPKKVKIGTVGPAVPGTELKIAEDGEILIKGGGVFLGYYNKPEATAEVLKDGWFASGDIGEIDSDGYLKITDRKKDIIVTAGGKKVPPQNLESELQTTPILGHVVVHGDQRKYLSAIVTLSPGAAKAYAAERGSKAETLEQLATNPQVQAGVQAAFDALNAKLPSYSTIKKFKIIPVEFSVESGDLTPKLSVKRKVLTQKYKAIFDSFYSEWKPSLSRLLAEGTFPAAAGNKEYDRELHELQLKLVRIHQAVYRRQRRVIVAFEGFDAAGKGGAIRRMTEALDPRGVRVWPIGPPEGDERGNHWLARFWSKLPLPGTLAVFDRTWAGRVLVERVDRLAKRSAWKRAYREINEFERQLRQDGIVLVKIFLAITKDEQLRRFRERLSNPYKQWKLTEDDLRARASWDGYVEAADDLFQKTSKKRSPWHVIPANDKLHARREVLRLVTEALGEEHAWMEAQAKEHQRTLEKQLADLEKRMK